MVNCPRKTGGYYRITNGSIKLAFLASAKISRPLTTVLLITRAVDCLRCVFVVGELLASVIENTRVVKSATFAGRNASSPQARQSVPAFQLIA